MIEQEKSVLLKEFEEQYNQSIRRMRETGSIYWDGRADAFSLACVILRDFTPVSEQKHAEWTEEDEKMFENFMHKLEVCDLLTNKEIRWAKLRLKSLRPQPHWKPSEEQMDCLVVAASGYGNSEVADVLNSLINDLKIL